LLALKGSCYGSVQVESLTSVAEKLSSDPSQCSTSIAEPDTQTLPDTVCCEGRQLGSPPVSTDITSEIPQLLSVGLGPVGLDPLIPVVTKPASAITVKPRIVGSRRWRIV
jgi:hypothetical protein